jgi:hypothetical protein
VDKLKFNYPRIRRYRMDPTIIASIVSTSGNLASTLFQKWDSSPSPSQNKIDKLLEKYFDEFRKYLSNNCVKILIYAESGENIRAEEFRKTIYPQIKYGDPLQKELDNEFEYRLRYLATWGLLDRSIQSEYFITRLGRSFVEKARKTSEYHPLFCPK